ncbi:CD209 antigen-like isoform X2 [Erinaceus europaeus]|nr:CD209 antigen-like isoform X2 [Erinaceus europaeus]
MNITLTALCYPCPRGWEHFEESCYFFSRSQKTWEASVAACQNLKAQLVIINSEAEERFLQAWEVRNKKRTWIGLSDQHHEGSWHWVDGTPLQLSFWNEGEPNNISEEDCAEYFVDGWNDSLCHLEKACICEKASSPCQPL